MLAHAIPGNGGCRLLAASLELQGRAGGDLPRLLRSLASALDDRAQVEAELRALTAQARFSAVAVPLLPFGALALLRLAEPRGVELLLTTPVGLAVVGVAALLDIVRRARDPSSAGVRTHEPGSRVQPGPRRPRSWRSSAGSRCCALPALAASPSTALLAGVGARPAGSLVAGAACRSGQRGSDPPDGAPARGT